MQDIESLFLKTVMKVAETVDSRLYFAVGNDLLPCALATCIQPAGKFLLLCRCIILCLREVIIFVEQNHNKLMGSADHVTSCGLFVFFSSVFGAKKKIKLVLYLLEIY